MRRSFGKSGVCMRLILGPPDELEGEHKMNDKYQAVIDKLDAEAEKERRPEIRAIETMLREVCKNSEAACDGVLADGKTMSGALVAMREAAAKRKGSESCVCIPPDEAERIIFKYYGISEASAVPEAPKSQTSVNTETVSLFDLL